MTFKTLFTLIANGQLSLVLQLQGQISQQYRSSFAATALAEGLYGFLREGPASLDQLYERLIGHQAADDAAHEAALKEKLEVWLNMGVILGELKLTPAGYALRSRLSRQLAEPANDGIAALYQEACAWHHELINQTPARLRARKLFTLADLDGKLIARASRILEPFILDVVDSVVPAAGAAQLLEVGCGSGVYIQRACQLNPELRAVGLELEPAVADVARQNVKTWGLAARVRVETGDIRNYASPDHFDLVTLHNNIYYFPVAERLGLVRRLVDFLVPGGKLLVTTGCRGYPSTQALNLWGEMTEGVGPLPEVRDVPDLLRQAGLGMMRKTELLPGGSFWAFAGTKQS